jgi:hypothetical protein
MSRRRVFLCVRFCDDLHQRFQSLFPRVERSHTTLRQSFATLTKTVEQMSQVSVLYKCRSLGLPDHDCLFSNKITFVNVWCNDILIWLFIYCTFTFFTVRAILNIVKFVLVNLVNVSSMSFSHHLSTRLRLKYYIWCFDSASEKTLVFS